LADDQLILHRSNETHTRKIVPLNLLFERQIFSIVVSNYYHENQSISALQLVSFITIEQKKKEKEKREKIRAQLVSLAPL
jgi:hypothetical protein